jgi:hypothetical protein
LNKDIIACLNSQETVQGAYLVLDSIQRLPRKEQQVAAVLCCGMVMADVMGERLTDILTTLDNLQRDSTRKLIPNVVAMRHYFEKEVFNADQG